MRNSKLREKIYFYHHCLYRFVIVKKHCHGRSTRVFLGDGNRKASHGHVVFFHHQIFSLLHDALESHLQSILFIHHLAQCWAWQVKVIFRKANCTMFVYLSRPLSLSLSLYHLSVYPYLSVSISIYIYLSISI